MASARAFITDLLARADIKVNGDRPWDITIHDERVFSRVLSKGTLGLGESYMDGWWDVPQLDQFFARTLSAHLERQFRLSLPAILLGLRAIFSNLQSHTKAVEVAEKHYDLDNALYESFLDPYNQYTCGYFKNTEDLAVAQEQKLDLICRKLHLKPGDRVLDIGCGWGGFAKFAAERYGARVVGITLSKEQLAYAQEFTRGLSVELRLQDYRDVHEQFDHIVSVGMFEHVGYKNYRTYMEVVARCLKDDGLFLLHTIGGNRTRFNADPWFHKYIFPNGMLPSTKLVGAAIEGIFVMEDWHNFGAYYDKTLMAWFKNFDAAWPRLKGKYDERFYRMWKYYLLCMAGAFRSRANNQLWQIVLSKNGVRGGYESVR